MICAHFIKIANAMDFPEHSHFLEVHEVPRIPRDTFRFCCLLVVQNDNRFTYMSYTYSLIKAM
jgi:hypothetical protein